MTEKGEQFTPAVERIPTYDSFGDPDEALAWVLEKLSAVDAHGIGTWWTSSHEALGDVSPEVAWDDDPNLVIRLVATL